MSTLMDFNTLKAQIVEEVKHSLSHYIESRVDELLRAFFAPLFVPKPEEESFTPLQSSKSSLSVDNTPVETSEESKIATLNAEEHEFPDDRSSTAASSRLSVLDKPSSALDFFKIAENARQYYLPISEPMPNIKSLFVTFNDSSQGLLHIICQYRRQFCRVIPGFRSLYRQLVANYKSSDIAYEENDSFHKIQELQNLLYDYLNSWLKDKNYLGKEKRISGIRHMWRCDHPGEERVLVVGLSFDMFDSAEMKMNKDEVCQVITAFFVKKIDVNPLIMKLEDAETEKIMDPSDSNAQSSKPALDSLQTSNVSDFEINKATLRVLLNGNDPAYLYRKSPCFGKMVLPIGKHPIAKHEVRIMFNNVNQGILHLLIVCFDRFRKILPQFESLPAEVSTRRDILHVAGNVSHNIDFHGEDALIYLQCVVYSFLHSTMALDTYLGYETRSIGTRHIWSLPKSIEDNFVLALTTNDELIIEGNKCYYRVDTAFFLPLSHVTSYKMIQSPPPSKQSQSPIYLSGQPSIRRRRSYDPRRNRVNFERMI